MTKPLSWFEIPTSDIDTSRSFYEAVFGIYLNAGHDLDSATSWPCSLTTITRLLHGAQ